MLHDRSVKIGTIYNPTIFAIGSCRVMIGDATAPRPASKIMGRLPRGQSGLNSAP
jgi:hypothetical protein